MVTSEKYGKNEKSREEAMQHSSIWTRSEVRKAFTRRLKDSNSCFVFASCDLLPTPLELPLVSLSSRRGQGAMLAQPNLKVLHMRMLKDGTSVPLRAKGLATFKTPEDHNLELRNLTSGKQDANP